MSYYVSKTIRYLLNWNMGLYSKEYLIKLLFESKLSPAQADLFYTVPASPSIYKANKYVCRVS